MQILALIMLSKWKWFETNFAAKVSVKGKSMHQLCNFKFDFKNLQWKRLGIYFNLLQDFNKFRSGFHETFNSSPKCFVNICRSLPRCVISLVKFRIENTFYRMLLRIRTWFILSYSLAEQKKKGDPSISRLQMWCQDETYSSNNHLTFEVECTSIYILQASS